MDSQEKKAFNWVVRQGNITLFADKDKVFLEIKSDNNSTCLLEKSDADDIISILTDLSGSIWDDPAYQREPYTGKLYELDDNGKAYWDIGNTRLFLGVNDQEDALEMYVEGDPVMKASVNTSIEIIQIMSHFSNRL